MFTLRYKNRDNRKSCLLAYISLEKKKNLGYNVFLKTNFILIFWGGTILGEEREGKFPVPSKVVT